MVFFCFSEVFFFFLRFYLFIFREGKGRRKEEKHQCVVASHASPTGDLAHNPGMCPHWESNQQPFGSQAGTQSTEPHQPGLLSRSILILNLLNQSSIFLSHFQFSSFVLFFGRFLQLCLPVLLLNYLFLFSYF